MHAKTPNLAVKDPRGLGIASVAYFRDRPAGKAEARIHRQRHDVAGRPVLNYDPRLFKLLETEPDARPNLRTVFNLTGAALFTDNVDTGNRLALFGLAGQPLIGWDSVLTQVQTEYDTLLRPIRTLEQAQGSRARRSAFYTYGENSPGSASRNQCGRLIRHDDDAGTVLFNAYALTGGVVSQSRHLLQELNEPDWPLDEADRDLLNETGNGATTRIAYNALGNAILQADAQDNIQQSDLDIAGQLRQSRLKLAGQTHEASLLNDIRYDANGNVERQTAGNGVVSEALYDPRDGRLMSVKAGLAGQLPLQDLAYGYDRVGNILSIRDTTRDTRFFRNQKIEPVQSYVYDSLYQLIKATGWQRIGSHNGPQEPVFVSPPDPGQLENYRQVYSYDDGGNLTMLVHTAASHGWTQRTAISKYSNRGLEQKADGSLPDEDEIGAGFDANGNRTQLLTGQDLTWSLSNRLRQVDQVVREHAPNDSEIYVYDGAGQRKRKVRLTYTALTRTHEVRYLPSLEIRTSPSEEVHVISVQAGRCAVQVLHWKSGPPHADQYRYNLTNHLGSSTLELDDRANLISEEMYYPYGGTSWWAGPDKVQASYKTRRYSGQERDATGLYYYGQRYYAPWLERWINADPAGAVDGLNLFRFVRNNPVTFLDNDGQITVEAMDAFDHVLAQGDAWGQLDQSSTGLAAFQKLSKDNIKRLEDQLEQRIELESANAIFLNAFDANPFHIVHFSDQDLRHDNVVELFSRKQLVNRGVIFNSDNTATGDLTHFATDDFVFFSLEAQHEPAKSRSRFGDKRYRAPLSILQESGQMQTSMLQTLDIIFPATRPKAAPSWVDNASAYLKDFALRDNEDEDTQRRHAMFVGEDIVHGMGLNVMIDVLTYATDPTDTLFDVSADKLMNSLYRPQVLVPNSVKLRPPRYTYTQTS
ncbi:RHS repeat protein [Pseudomonas sp. SAICEU22]|uniref:RHS repeat protein n=1 Tax=Pseudomonas agronomica TaxID=2979328 RepID=A0ABT3F5S5_9PSED|nr:RHS repeat-associated core domain-containing protein [Pseudomonas agronomica]MCW1244450.1 RHS repeat protein [Pseudomonas agronomica]